MGRLQVVRGDLGEGLYTDPEALPAQPGESDYQTRKVSKYAERETGHKESTLKS